MSNRIVCFNNVRYFDHRHTSLQGPVDITVSNGKIVFGKLRADEYVDASSYIMMPSFAQLHVHLCQHLYKGIAEDLSLFDWLEKRILPYEMNLSSEDLYLSAKLALYEMIDSGTTAIMDMGTFHNQHAIYKAMNESNIRGFSGNILMDREIGTFRNELQNYISYSEEMIRETDSFDNVSYALNPRFLPGITGKGIESIMALRDKYDLIIHTHASETEEEVEFSKELFDAGNIEVMDRFNMLGERTVIAHCIHINETETEMLKTSGSNVAHCPSANMKLGSGIAGINDMINRNINVGIGTDGAPCNNNHSQMLEMRLAGLLQKVKFGSETMPAAVVFKAGTVNGFHAMGFNNAGIIENNADADFLLIKKDGIHQSLFEINPHGTVIYSADKNDIDWVIGNGNILKRDGVVTVFERGELIEKRRRFLKDLCPDRF